MLIAQNIHTEWNKLANVQSLREATQLGDQLFDAAEKLSVERDVAFSMLYTADEDSLKDLRARLDDSRQDTDRVLTAALDAV